MTDNVMITDAKELSDEEVALADIIRLRMGIVIHRHQWKEFQNIVADCCQQFSCQIEECLDIISKCPVDHPMLAYFVTRVTVSESYFFRDRFQIRLLKDTIIKNIIRIKREQQNNAIRIWSAGCATGEEIYTIAMLLTEALPDIADWSIKLLGTDINAMSLKKAIAGEYGEWSMQSMSPCYKVRYFKENKHHYLISDQIRKMVSFEYLNLNDDTFPSELTNTTMQDLIVCRNVLIYFDTNIINHVMKKFSACLNRDGLLLLGVSDPINMIGTDLQYHHHDGALFSNGCSYMQSTKSKRNTTTFSYAANFSEKSKIDNPIEVTIVEKGKHKTAKDDAMLSMSAFEKQIEALLDVGKWEDVIVLINHQRNSKCHSPFILGAKANALANLGQLQEAAKACVECLGIDPMNKYIYFTYALVLSEMNHDDQCEEALRKTLVLDNQFVAGHFQLGMLLLRKNRIADGLKSLQNALSIVNTCNPEDPVPGSRKLCYGKLSEILQHEIRIYQQ